MLNHDWEKKNWMDTFPKGISASEMQSASFRIWTHVAMSISYDDNYYTMGTTYIYIYIYIWVSWMMNRTFVPEHIQTYSSFNFLEIYFINCYTVEEVVCIHVKLLVENE